MQSQPVPHRDDISHLSEIFRREVKLKMYIVYCRIWTNTEKKFLLGTKSVDFQLTLQTISQLLIQKYISSHFNHFLLAKTEKETKWV